MKVRLLISSIKSTDVLIKSKITAKRRIKRLLMMKFNTLLEKVKLNLISPSNFYHNKRKIKDVNFYGIGHLLKLEEELRF